VKDEVRFGLPGEVDKGAADFPLGKCGEGRSARPPSDAEGFVTRKALCP
jgi:hypothetical protein